MTTTANCACYDVCVNHVTVTWMVRASGTRQHDAQTRAKLDHLFTSWQSPVISKSSLRSSLSSTMKTQLNWKCTNDMNRHFTKEVIQIANKHLERHSTSYITREFQVKTKMGHHYIPIAMTKIWNTVNTKWSCGCGARGTPIRCWWPCKMVPPLWKTVL